MSRLISLNARIAHDAMASTAVEVVMFIFSHPDLEEPVRLSTDPTVRLSVQPLRYGTRSTWLTSDAKPFYFALLSAVWPDDRQGAAPEASLVVANLDNAIARSLLSINGGATVDMALVLSSSPDRVEMQYRAMTLKKADGDEDRITVSFAYDFATEAWPSGTMSQFRFSGMFR